MAIDKRAARTEWKDRDTEWIVFTACTGGRTWVGVSPNVKAIENRLRFTLKLGDCRTKGMQAAYDGTLTIEPLEQLDPTLGQYALQDAIKARRTHWCTELDATPIEA